MDIDQITLEMIFAHLASIAGFLLAVLVLARIVRQERSSTGALAWLLTIIFIPYVGVPLYLALSGRKIGKHIGRKKGLKLTCTNAVGIPADAGPPAEASEHEKRPSIVLITSGVDAFNEVLGLIADARNHICIATYVLGRGETGQAFVQALTLKAAAGVPVYLLLDALGSYRAKGKFLAPLVRAGGRVSYFMPMLHLPFRGRANLRNHRKIVLSDGRAGLTGGMNIASEYMGPSEDPKRWRDIAVRIEGPALGPLYDIFRSDWEFAAGKPLDDAVHAPACMDGGNGAGVIASGPDCPTDALRDAIILNIFQAGTRIWIVTPYFVPDEVLLESLCIVARRGIDVRLIIPDRSNHRVADLARTGYLNQMQTAGASVRLFQPGMLHAKAVLFDDDLAMVGSANMDVRSLLLNYEVALTIHDAPVLGEIKAWMEGLMAQCVQREAAHASSLSLWEGVARLFSPLL